MTRALDYFDLAREYQDDPVKLFSRPSVILPLFHLIAIGDLRPSDHAKLPPHYYMQTKMFFMLKSNRLTGTMHF